jgi:hypothetical protein
LFVMLCCLLHEKNKSMNCFYICVTTLFHDIRESSVKHCSA